MPIRHSSPESARFMACRICSPNQVTDAGVCTAAFPTELSCNGYLFATKTPNRTMKHAALMLCCLFTAPFSSFAQLFDLPATQVYAIDIEPQNDTIWAFSNPRYLTAFNSEGYNNQPAFVDNDQLLLTVQFADSLQSDIYLLDLRRKALTQVTATLESEFSPQLTPSELYFSAVRVELDPEHTQRLWRFPMDRLGYGEPVFQYLRKVGYYAWLSREEVALFIVNDPPMLVIADTQNGSTRPVLSNIGRGLARLPGGWLAFVHKERADAWYIKALDPATLQTRTLAPTLPGMEDFAVMPDGTLLQAHRNKLYKLHPARDRDWVLVADFKNYDIAQISRLAVSPNGRTLALVGLPSRR